MALKRINLNLDENLVVELDNYAQSLHVSRSSALSVILSQWFMQQKSMTLASDLVQIFQTIKPEEAASLLVELKPDKYASSN